MYKFKSSSKTQPSQEKACFLKFLRGFYLAVMLIFLFLGSGFTQTPKVKPTLPSKVFIKDATQKPQVNVSSKALAVLFENMFSSLQFAKSRAIDPESRRNDNFYWELTTYQTHPINNNPISKNWKEKLLWRKIPSGAVYGRWEISAVPFPPGDDASFNGIIEEGIIETNGADSIFFDMDYTDFANVNTDAINIKSGVFKNLKITDGRVNQPDTKPGQRPAKTPVRDINFNKAFYSNFQLKVDSARKFYIRIVPLDANKNAMSKFSNDIIMQEQWNKPLVKKPKIGKPPLSEDYVITGIKYIPVHFPEDAFYRCTVVTGYNEEFFKNYPDMAQSFKAAYPIGAVFCPQPPKDKAWYEKVIGGVLGFIEKAINGASEYYNDTKNYFKKKFMEFNCKANGSTILINPTSEFQKIAIQKAGGQNICEYLSDAVFDYGMTSVGLPPSLPNTADLTKMAEGQIVDLACDKIEMETNMSVQDDVREAIRSQVHNYIVEQSKKGTINCGFVNFKAYPAGQFQTAYLEVEVTRVSQNSNKTGVVDFSVSDKTTRNYISYNKIAKKSESRELSCNLFESTSASVPYLKNIGDKTTIYVVLKPQASYITSENGTEVITKITADPPIGEWYTPPIPTYEGYANTDGFQILCKGASTTKFKLGLKTANGLFCLFNN